jgi:hypothetical protein
MKCLFLVADQGEKSAFRPILFTNYKLKCGMRIKKSFGFDNIGSEILVG